MKVGQWLQNSEAQAITSEGDLRNKTKILTFDGDRGMQSNDSDADILASLEDDEEVTEKSPLSPNRAAKVSPPGSPRHAEQSGAPAAQESPSWTGFDSRQARAGKRRQRRAERTQEHLGDAVRSI